MRREQLVLARRPAKRHAAHVVCGRADAPRPAAPADQRHLRWPDFVRWFGGCARRENYGGDVLASPITLVVPTRQQLT